MRTPLLLLAVAALAVSFDRFVTSPSAEVVLAQNTGPLATPAVNPRLGGPPPGGHLGDTPAGAAGAPIRVPDGAPGSGTGAIDAVPPVGRLGAMNGDRLGAPPVRALPNARADALPAAPNHAVGPPVGNAVPPPATGAVAPLAQPNAAPPAALTR